MRREYFTGDGEKRKSKPGNVYFHFQVNCVKEKNQLLVPGLVYISPFVHGELNELHKRSIKSVLGIDIA